ncbi:MAG TPA: molybdopterin cofactor-binding domain-containing protein [Actinomycetota bacterium]|nr:molybdopterin cofactor-binding domain-containing protein [Actinomycetota bacterium]
MRQLRLTVNDVRRTLDVDPDESLLGLLREHLGLTGAKYSCGEGVCGACTVLVDSRPVRSCVTPAAEVDGRAVVTAEGLSPPGTLHPVAGAFAEAGAFQCGYCTPGMVVEAAALLERMPQPDPAAIREALNGHICRCGSYPRILEAVQRAGQAATPAAAPPAPYLPRPASPWDLAAGEEREWFSVLPEGLVVVLDPRPPGPGQWAPSPGAWLHVGGDGHVTAFIGKVEVGQGTRTALTLLAAEELAVAPSSVSLVMGDTDLCPYDEGTFGSLSMPQAGPAIQAVAAAAREELRTLAAGREEAPYGDLVRGLRLVVHARQPRVTPPDSWRVAGRAAGPVGAVDVVTGAKRFATDVHLPGMLHGAVLRAPAAGATLASVDLAAVDAMNGVVAVHEDGFVAVAAPDRLAARRALDGLRASWDRQPSVSGRGVSESLTEYLRTHLSAGEGWDRGFTHEDGDVDAARATADVTLAATYSTAYLAHVPMETRAALAAWEGGRLTVWVGTQRPFAVREALAEAMGVPQTAVRVIVPDTGTGFGGKHRPDVALEAARLARAAGRPVKVRWSSREEFTSSYFRPAAVIDIRTAAAGGALTAWEVTTINAGSPGIGCPYAIPNQRLVSQPAQSPLAQGSYRALAATANHFARESHIDELAHRLGADPVELRLRHLPDPRLTAVLSAAAEAIGWPDGPVGIACGVEKGAYVATAVQIAVTGEGAITVPRLVTAFDAGAVVSPENLARQVEGAAIMGLGGALFEAVTFEDGEICNPSLRQYRVPRFSDVGDVEAILIDRRDVPPAGGGETPILAVAPAIANALFRATGRRVRTMPLA